MPMQERKSLQVKYIVQGYKQNGIQRHGENAIASEVLLPELEGHLLVIRLLCGSLDLSRSF